MGSGFMQATSVTRQAAARPVIAARAVTMIIRLVGVAMLALTAAVHLRLYSHYGYRHIPTMGTMFLLNVIGGFSLAALLLAAPRRLVGLAAFAGAGYEVLTLAGFVYALYRPLFNFEDSTRAPLWKDAVTVEAIGIVVLSGITLVALNRWRSRSVTEG
jgi:hypothetical protein